MPSSPRRQEACSHYSLELMYHSQREVCINHETFRTCFRNDQWVHEIVCPLPMSEIEEVDDVAEAPIGDTTYAKNNHRRSREVIAFVTLDAHICSDTRSCIGDVG